MHTRSSLALNLLRTGRVSSQAQISRRVTHAHAAVALILRDSFITLQYAAVLAILLIAELAIAIVAAVNKDDFEEILSKGFHNSMEKYGPADNPLMESWNSMQKNVRLQDLLFQQALVEN